MDLPIVRIALIGAGRIGQVHARAIANHPQAELVLVCDPNATAADALAGGYGAKSCTDVADLWADDSVEAVIIGSPTGLHAEHLLAAVAAGKKVLCEKPIALDLHTARECVAELGEQADQIMIGFNRRFDPTFAEIRARVADGEVGDLQQLTIISRDPAPPSAAYVTGSGGMFKDMTIHDLDMARFFCGDIAEVSVVATNFEPGIKAAGDVDQAIVVLKSATGQLVTVINSRNCAYGYDQRIEAFGAKGSLVADNLTATAVRSFNAEVTEARGAVLDFFLERYVDAFRLELEMFITAIIEGLAVSPTVRDGLIALELADAAERSMKQGRTITLA